MGKSFSLSCTRKLGMTPDQALQILYDALTARPRAATEEAAPASGRKDGDDSFAAYCRRLDLPRHKLDRYIRKELGCGGQEWVEAVMFHSVPEMLQTCCWQVSPRLPNR